MHLMMEEGSKMQKRIDPEKTRTGIFHSTLSTASLALPLRYLVTALASSPSSTITAHSAIPRLTLSLRSGRRVTTLSLSLSRSRIPHCRVCPFLMALIPFCHLIPFFPFFNFFLAPHFFQPHTFARARLLRFSPLPP